MKFSNLPFRFIGWTLLFFTDYSCNHSQINNKTENEIEIREDSIELANAYAAQSKIKYAVKPDVETQNIKAGTEEDAADDPAIWVHPTDPSKSLVFGSNKRGGLAAYDLSGNEVAYYTIGNVNNVDILYNFSFGDSTLTLLGCSNRSDQSIDLFAINQEDGGLTDIANGVLGVDQLAIDDIYGFCFSKDLTKGEDYVLINGKNGQLLQFKLKIENDKVGIKLKKSIKFDSQTEGMVADNEYGFIYIGEEGKGIWKIPIATNSETEKIFITKSGEDNLNIKYDLEGLTLYKNGNEGYLIASSQGNFSYAVFERTRDNRYLFNFKISELEKIDGVEETDGLDVVSDSLNTTFPNGMLVVQDGFNYHADSLLPQNFKYIDWRKIEDLVNKL